MLLTIVSLNPTGLYSFGSRHGTIKLNNIGLTALDGINNDKNGSSNGSGKTSLFNAITTILFDKNPAGESGEAVINERLGACCAQLRFNIDDTQWRVIYTRKWKKTYKVPDDTYLEASDVINSGGIYSGTDLYLERFDGIWKDERACADVGATKLDIKATRSKISRLICMTYDQFVSISYLAQQQSLRFINGTHKERMQILNDISSMHSWDKRKAAVKERIIELERMNYSTSNEANGINQALAVMTQSTSTTNFAEQESGLMTEIVGIDTKAKENELSVSNLKELVGVLSATQAETKKRLRTATHSINAISAKKTELYNTYIKDRSIVTNRPVGIEYDQLKSDISHKKGFIVARRYDLEQIMPTSGRCPKCKSNVSAEHIARHKEMLLLEISEIEASIVDIEAKASSIYADWEQTVKHDTAVLDSKYESDLLGITKEYEIIANEQTVAEAELEEVTESINSSNKEIERLNREANDLNVRRLSIYNKIQNIKLEIKAEEKRKAEVDALSAKLKILTDNVESYTNEIKYLTVIEKMFGDKGIKAHKLNGVISQLNHAIQTNLDVISDGLTSVWITPFRESKADGEIIADIQIMVKDTTKTNVPFSLYSGGEKQQIVLAVIGAFWHVASLQGSGVNLLCLDEVFGPMDANNAYGAIKFLERMKSLGKNSILIVTHNKEISNQIAFDNQWVVTKTNGVSTLVD